MNTIAEKSYKKATQALNYYATRKDGSINKMKAIKLIYLADRLHLRKYGRPIVGDRYVAMKWGPVGSKTKNLAELVQLPDDVLSYAKKFIKPTEDKNTVQSLKAVDLDVFSKTDIECFDEVYKEFADKDQFELARLTHEYPEWAKYKKDIETGKKKSVPMSYEDFFSDGKTEKIFTQDKQSLSLAKELFEEGKEIAEFFSN